MAINQPTDAAANRPTSQALTKAASRKGMQSRPSGRLKNVLCLDDFETAAREHLPRPIFGYISGASETNRSLHANREAFDDYAFLPRVMVDISKRKSNCTLFGETYSSPIGISPMGLSALSSYRGDIVLARAAAAAGIPMIMSGSSLIRLEDVAATAPQTWFQAYLPGDAAAIEALIDRVAAAGYKRLVITVDTPTPSNRENNVRTGFSTPLRPSLRLAMDGISHPRWLFGTFLRTIVQHGMPHFENNYVTRGAPILSPNVERDFSDRGHLNWEHLARIRKQWKSTLVIKGILNVHDARIARDIGADGIMVSNHGGRQLDGAISPLRVLPEIVQACPEIPVLMDSGVRRGTDVLKALALGAKCVFVGRPFAYAAAVGGEAGVTHAIRLLAKEVSTGMAMLGITSLDQLNAESYLRKLR